ncbi:MAG: methylenetetrahydrofolate reductase [Bacteroidaceae bacterium]|nr:methylenetetrahydrofolate reductase [NAD(P)H] [Bacteroidaceae bacterium]
MQAKQTIDKTGGQQTGFSFEVLPPLKGMGIERLFADIDMLREFNPQYVNITTHRSERIYRETAPGLFERVAVRKRPGTVAVAAAIKARYGIPVVPHILCSGFTREETEYVLIDLQFLGITDLLVLRGDKAKDDASFTPTPGGYSHATELQEQINRFNAGYFDDGTPIQGSVRPFTYGVACYPEKHIEAPNMESDLHWLLKKQEGGAQYAVTQLFYDNAVYFRFVERARAAGITIPIIPGIKPLTKASQLTIVPKTFNVDIPVELTEAVRACKDDEAVRRVGVEWCTAQCQELIRHGVPRIHFYVLGATQSVRDVAKVVF